MGLEHSFRDEVHWFSLQGEKVKDKARESTEYSVATRELMLTGESQLGRVIHGHACSLCVRYPDGRLDIRILDFQCLEISIGEPPR